MFLLYVVLLSRDWIIVGPCSMQIPPNHRTATAEGPKTNTADKHILRPKPAGFGLLLPLKKEEEKSTPLVLRCEVNRLTQPCHYKVNTDTCEHTLCKNDQAWQMFLSRILLSKAYFKTCLLKWVFCQIFCCSCSSSCTHCSNVRISCLRFV